MHCRITTGISNALHTITWTHMPVILEFVLLLCSSLLKVELISFSFIDLAVRIVYLPI